MTPSSTPSLTISQNQAKQLAGKRWRLQGELLVFADYSSPGEPPWISGSEGMAFPLLAANGKPRAYVKFFDELKVGPKRIARTKWLVRQRLDAWTPELCAAPKAWIDTAVDGRPEGVGFDFACPLAQAVPGLTWTEMKLAICERTVQLSEQVRARCVQNLLRALIYLEQHGVTHGDLSPNNVIVNLDASGHEPALCLIDFDAYVAPAAGSLSGLSIGEGGTFGTVGYCPPELAELNGQAALAAAPYSDRFGRDMLLIELLAFDEAFNPEAPPSQWEPLLLQAKLHSNPIARQVNYLQRQDALSLQEAVRPSSYELARQLGLPTPPRIKTPRPPRPRSGRWQSRFVEPVLQRAIPVLWLLCLVHLALVSYWSGSWMRGGAGLAGWLQLGASALFSLGMFTGGAAAISWLASTGERLRVLDLPLLKFVALEPSGRRQSRLARLAFATLGLVAALMVLVAISLILARIAQ